LTCSGRLHPRPVFVPQETVTSSMTPYLRVGPLSTVYLTLLTKLSHSLLIRLLYYSARLPVESSVTVDSYLVVPQKYHIIGLARSLQFISLGLTWNE
jgi:hypothetical protein